MRNIPVLHVEGKTLAEAYEKALIELWANGCRFKTQYDKPEDPESIDATMNITVDEPLTDPMIHKAFPGGFSDLREYVMELQGVKDHWVKNLNDSEDTRWEYTYHGRFKHYGQWFDLQYRDCNDPKFPIDRIVCGYFNIDQIEFVIDKLCKQPCSRQAQMITWMPNLDLDIFDPPCLQSIWCRIMEEDGVRYLNYNIRIRSNDSWGAYFMNSFGITMFVKEIIADEIAKRTGKEVRLGRMNWQADSWHIYGKDIQQAKERLFDRLEATKFEDRVYDFYDPDIQEMYYEEDENIKKKIAEYDQRYSAKK
jgi:thymidylate synthase